MTTGRFIQTICTILLYISIQAPALSNDTARPDSNISQAGHKQVNCSACHLFGQSVATSPDQLRMRGVCISCHTFTEHTGTTVSAIHQSIDSPCQTCHAIHSELSDDNGSVPRSLPNRSSGFECLSCHNQSGSFGNLSPGHQKAAELYHRGGGGLKDNTPSGTCMYCHSDQGNSGETLPRLETAPAIHRVSSHPYGVPANGSGGSFAKLPRDVPVPLNDGMIECQTCHSLTSGRPFDLIPFASSYDLCLACHPDKTPPSMSAEITP